MRPEMLSIGRIGTGDGYKYLTNQVASMDGQRAGERLVSYYERTGYPPGQWIGAQAEAFGLAGTVDEASMDALFGHCADPRTGRALGRRMAIYRSFEERVQDRLQALGHDASEEERAQIDATEAERETPQAVAGFDQTFSAPKSVSVLFALGDEATREAVRAAHEAAWRDAFAYFESEVAATRLGGGGVAQVDVQGVAAASFEHWFSRAGDPQLHTHVATSVMVRTTDGRWRRLDSRALYRAAAPTGERYTATLMTELTNRLGVGWRHRSSGRSETLLPEIAGVDDALIHAFSTRSAAIKDGQAGLVAQYKAKHGRVPDRATLARLAQQATLADRPAGEHRSLADSQATWLAEAAQVLGCGADQVTKRLAHQVRSARTSAKTPRQLRRRKVGYQAHSVVERLEETSATWSGWELRRAATAQLREAGFRADEAAVNRVINAVVDLDESVAIGPSLDDEDPIPEAFRRGDGSSIFERRGEERWTSTRVLTAEADIVALASSRNMAKHERARRVGAIYGELDDDAVLSGIRRATTHVGSLRTRLSEAHAAAASAQDELAQAGVSLSNYGRDGGPAQRAEREAAAAEDLAATRLGEVQAALARRGLHRPRGAELGALEAERGQILAGYPGAADPEPVRLSRNQAAQAGASRLDATTRAALIAMHSQAREQLNVAAGHVGLLEAEVAEQAQAVGALLDEHTWRNDIPGRVKMDGYLEGLGSDQADAVVRLADPSRPLDALIGPAGAGKTTALAALVRAFGDQGHKVHVLASTAVAAIGLGEAVGAPHATLHAALGRWRKGRGVPGAGDLVLVDEASMATTPMLLQVARLAISRGALVRLVGDPRQLKAVGAGGGLGLVADAVRAPELTELHRFNHAWEAEATLALRKGNVAALDTYIAHDRLVGSLDAVAVEEVFEAWWTSPAGLERTLMVASDNATVRVLNTLARTARIEAGEVAPGGAVLFDSTLAGVGDVITTRDNARVLATRRNGGKAAHVWNHDRWRVEGVGVDGSLVVSHLTRTDRVKLPAAYVAAHVELGYADTGHSVQGRTVDRAEVLVRGSDTRWYLYVAMSRGRDHNVAHVVVDQVDEEPAGYHPTHGPREVLAAVLGRDEPVSASEWARAADAARTDPGLIAERYRTGAVEELRGRLANSLASHGGAEVLVGDDGWRVVAAAEAAEAAGLDAPAVLAARGSGDAEVLEAALEAARVSRTDPIGRARAAPLLAGVMDAPGAQVAPDVAVWLGAQATRLEAWRDDLAARLSAGQEAPPWAAGLGPPPRKGLVRVGWATQVAQVALYRATHQVEDTSLLGPELAPGSSGGAARARAALAVERARTIVSDGQVPAMEDDPPARRHASGGVGLQTKRRPKPNAGPRMRL